MKFFTIFFIFLLSASCRKQQTTGTSAGQVVDGIDSGNFIVIDSVYHYRHTGRGHFDCKIETLDHGVFTILTVNWQNNPDSVFSGMMIQDGGVSARMLLSINRNGVNETYVCQGAKLSRTGSDLYYPFTYSGVKMFYTDSKIISYPPTDSSRFVVVSGLNSCR